MWLQMILHLNYAPNSYVTELSKLFKISHEFAIDVKHNFVLSATLKSTRESAIKIKSISFKIIFIIGNVLIVNL